MASDLFTYLLHYTIARTVYELLFRKQILVGVVVVVFAFFLFRVVLRRRFR